MKLWFLILAMPMIASAYSPTSQQDCSSLDLRNETLGKVRNQKDVSWCYAFTSADMLAHTFNEAEKISAADIAIGYNQTPVGLFVRWFDLNLLNPKDPILPSLSHQTGFNKISLTKAMQVGWCPERILPSESWSKMSRDKGGWTQAEVPLAQAMLEISALHAIRHSLTPQNIPFYYSFKNVDATVFVQLLQTKNVARVYSSLRKAVCRDDRHPFNYNWKVKMVIKNSKIFSRISEQLEKGRLVALDYDSRILKDSSNRGFKISQLHTSSVVGRRWNESKHTCEFLIRNSYGEDCNSKYDPRYECDSGNLWLNELQMYRSMTSISYMLSGNTKEI